MQRLERPIWVAVELRRSRHAIDNSVIGPDQAIAIDEALKAITVNATQQIGLEDRLGTLEPGGRSDDPRERSLPRPIPKIIAIKVREELGSRARRSAAEGCEGQACACLART